MLPQRMTFFDIYKEDILLAVNCIMFLICAFCATTSMTIVIFLLWYFSAVICLVIILIRIIARHYWS